MYCVPLNIFDGFQIVGLVNLCEAQIAPLLASGSLFRLASESF